MSHCYADDTHIYFTMKPRQEDGPAQRLKNITLQALRVGDCLVRLTHSVRNLGVQFDAEMTMESHVTSVCKSAIFQFKILLLTHRALTDHRHGYIEHWTTPAG